jgi:hypothetical protein
MNVSFSETPRGNSGRTRKTREAGSETTAAPTAASPVREIIDNDLYQGGVLVNGVELLVILDYSIYKK